MPTVLSTHPNAAFTNLVGKTNSNTVTQFLNTGGFPANTLYFAGFNSTPVEVFGGLRYLVEWQVVYNPRKWVIMESPIYDPDSDSWSTTEVDAYERDTFSFTVHTVVT
jgi:hypothetical protein